MGRVRRERDKNEKENRSIHRMKLGRGENDDGFEKIKERRDRGTAPFKNLVGNEAGNEGTGGGHKRNRRRENLKFGGLEIDVVHFPHEKRKPLIDPLSVSAGAGVGAGDDPNDGIRHDDFKDIEDPGLNLAAGFLLRIHRGKARFFRRVFDDQRHAHADDEGDSGWNPKEPAPMQRRNTDQTEKDKSGQERRAEIVDSESAE